MGTKYFLSFGTFALIDRLVVDKPYRNMGVGTILLTESLTIVEKFNVRYFLLTT